MVRRIPVIALKMPVWAALLTWLLLSGSAAAQFSVCNRTIDVVNVAVSYEVESGSDRFSSEGWWTIGANQCANVIREPLQTRYIYIHAMDVFGHPILYGTTEFCISKRAFKIDVTEDCWEYGYITAKFIEVDTQAVERWTLFLTTPQQ